MRILLNHGLLARRQHKNGLDAGFTPLMPGNFTARLSEQSDEKFLVLQKHNGEFAYLPLNLVEELIFKGSLLVLET
jgi:hypothetical protein